MADVAAGVSASVRDPFADRCRTLIIMRTCISCGDPIPEKKRKDAKYCDKAACRGREYRKKRQAEAATSEAKHATRHSSTVLICSCGKRYLLQVCSLDEQATGKAPEMSPSTSTPEAFTQTAPLTDQGPDEPAPHANAHAEPAEALTQTDQTDPPSSNLATLELYFTNGAERRIPFSQAVHRQSDGRWALDPRAQVAFSFGEADRPCLGGRPGAWRKFYGERSPSEFGYDPDLVVMFWDQKSRRGRAASASVLRDILGDGWKDKLRALCDEK